MFVKSCPRSLHSGYRSKPVSQRQLGRQQREPRTRANRSPKRACVSGGERGHFRDLERHHVTESTVGSSHLQSDFSLYCRCSLMVIVLKAVPKSHKQIIVTEIKIALASISRYLPRKVKTTIA